MAERFDQRLRIEGCALDPVGKEPYDKLKGNEKTDDRFEQQQSGSPTAVPTAMRRQTAHLAAQEDIERHCTQQPAQIGCQFDKDRDTQSDDDDKQRINR